MEDLYFSSASSDSESSSDDEQIINFVERLGRIRKIPRIQIRRDHFHYWDDSEFYNRFRLSKETTTNLLEQISDSIEYPTNWNHALMPMEMLLITLRFFACGSFLIVIGDFGGIHKSTTSKIIYKVTRAIAGLKDRYITMPETEDERSVVQMGFYQIARFPRVVGALDCTHVKIKSPGGANAEVFRNRKNVFSLNVQTISDSTLKIMDVVARWPGSSHDSTIFRNSQICGKFESGAMGTAVLVGDAGYGVRNYLLTPLANTNTLPENLYNESIIRTRNPVERSYGVWKRRFPILSNGINLVLPKVQWIIVATAVLHNIAIQSNEQDPPELTEEQQRAFDLCNNVPVENYANNVNNNNVVRNEFIQYFGNI